MSLVSQWKTDSKAFDNKSIQQLLAWCGDGVLKDDGATGIEFRDFLAHIPSELLTRYAQQCLELKFQDSGLALQDIVNQIGKRLGFQIINGRYRGIPNQIGFDGLWQSPEGTTILVEVKTTDAYRLALETTATYRKKLIHQEKLPEEKSSILYIVGRFDTGELEAQVRGSKHAWDIRIVSVDALLSLLRIKEELEDRQTIDKIREVLTPREYTRVDGIIDLVFSATKEAKNEEGAEVEEEEEKKDGKKFTPVKFRAGCIDRLSLHFQESLIKQTSAIFSTPDDKIAVLAATSRTYKKSTGPGYWFAFHPSQKETLGNYQESFVCLGCGSEQNLLLISLTDFIEWLNRFNQTTTEDRAYWHIHVSQVGKSWKLGTKSGFDSIDVTKYLLPPTGG